MNLIVMGVSGCGKSTVGNQLAELLGAEFLEGDAFHSPKNIARMKAGIPLTDDDRAPWIEQLCRMIVDHKQQQRSFVLTCSALKKAYRKQLATSSDQLVFVYLKGDQAEIYKRMAGRTDHFMALSLADSQFEALEEPGGDENTITVDISNSVREIVDQVARALARSDHH